MTDTPKRFPYGGGPARTRWVNPRIAAERGIEVADLPRDEIYAEPAFDVPVDDGAPSLALDPGADLDLDFEGDFGATADAIEQARSGPSGADHLAQDVFAYAGWECDCKATAKSGIPPRHIRQYLAPVVTVEAGRERRVEVRSKHDTDYKIMVLPGKGEIKQGKGEGNVVEVDDEGHPIEQPEAVECPTWRPAVREWVRPARDWSKGKHGIKPPPEPEAPKPEPTHPAGPIGEPEPLALSDLPPRCTAKSLLRHAASAHKVSGRRVDDGPVVTRFRLAGAVPAADGEQPRRWVAFWTEGKFDEGRIDGRPAGLPDVRALLK